MGLGAPGSGASTWVLVVSLEHARRGVEGGFVMANHGKRAPLARMRAGDGLLIYSPTTTYPGGAPLRAVTIAGRVTGEEPEPSDVIAGGFRRGAELTELREAIPLAELRDHLPSSRLRFGCFELGEPGAGVIWREVGRRT